MLHTVWKVKMSLTKLKTVHFNQVWKKKKYAYSRAPGAGGGARLSWLVTTIMGENGRIHFGGTCGYNCGTLLLRQRKQLHFKGSLQSRKGTVEVGTHWGCGASLENQSGADWIWCSDCLLAPSDHCGWDLDCCHDDTLRMNNKVSCY